MGGLSIYLPFSTTVISGPVGLTGIPGLSGRDGIDGKPGLTGAQGKPFQFQLIIHFQSINLCNF